MTSPPPDVLTDAHVAAIVRAQDEAAGRLAEITARDPSVPAVRTSIDERQDALAVVVDAYVAAGLDRERAGRAATVWLIERLDPATCVRRADEAAWLRPGDTPPGTLGLSRSD